MIYALAAKILIDGAATISFLKQPPLALMFFGFTVCDVAGFWIKFKGG